jgi:hypothetical protein
VILRSTADAEEPEREFWSALGFETDMVVHSRYLAVSCPGCGEPLGEPCRSVGEQG